MKTIWVLTSSYNDYDQHGEYFEAAWTERPSLEAIQELCGTSLEHASRILNTGGGRRGSEYYWYNLREYEEGKK